MTRDHSIRDRGDEKRPRSRAAVAKALALLRSRKLAVVLLVALTAYSWLATLVPPEAAGPAAASAWDAAHPGFAVLVNAIGLHHAFSNPVFLAAALLLAISTAACAWERTGVALRGARSRRGTPPEVRVRLSSAPDLVLAPAGPSDEALAGAADALRRLRMRVGETEEMVSATSGGAGLLGSPLLHWALVGLFVFAGLGQLTRYEGYVDALPGDTVRDEPATYRLDLRRGVLTPDSAFSGLDVTVKELEQDHVVAGVSRGPAPLVLLSRGDSALKEQWVFPNSPLRYGSLLIQGAASDPALVGTVRVPTKGVDERVVLYYDTTTRAARGFDLPDPVTGDKLTVEVAPLGGKKVAVGVHGGSAATTQTLGAGQVASIANGATFTIDALTYGIRLQVVNDWSVPWIYAMFGLGCLGAALTAFVPPRTVRVLAVDGRDGCSLHVEIARRRSDPAFPGRVERALREAMPGQGGTASREETRA